MNGVLLIDKPRGPTSHDVVARLRRTSGERSIGHTGTLDPRATGLLPLVLGNATRLASLLSGRDKTYEAGIHLGFQTDTDDADGDQVGDLSSDVPDDDTIEAALAGFRGTFDQTPPSHSAKRVGGARAYDLARRSEPVELAPVKVTVRSLVVTGRQANVVSVEVVASSGFYVRALARDLGRALGCGGHLASLRRTRSGSFDVAHALPLEDAERMDRDIVQRLLTPAEAVANLPSVCVTEAGLKRAIHGNPLGPGHLEGRWIPPASTSGPIRVLAGDGQLIALAHSRGGALHPVIVLG